MSCGCAERREAIVKAVKRVGQFIKGNLPMNYIVVKTIQHNGVWYDPGAPFEMDERDSSYLIEAGAIELPAAADTIEAEKPKAT
jgi:hypothetical protein